MARKAKGEFMLIALVAIAAFVVYVVSVIATALSNIGSLIVTFKGPVVLITVSLACAPLLFLIYEHLYFKSKKFQDLRKSVSDFINNCNQLNHHIAELKGSYIDIKTFDYGSGSMKDESKFNFKRTEWSKHIKSNYVHHCSAAVCKNAGNQPLKYLCKYFDIDISEESLSNFEGVLNNFAAAEQGKYLLRSERDSILANIESSIPWVINNFSKKKLIKAL